MRTIHKWLLIISIGEQDFSQYIQEENFETEIYQEYEISEETVEEYDEQSLSQYEEFMGFGESEKEYSLDDIFWDRRKLNRRNRWAWRINFKDNEEEAKKKKMMNLSNPHLT